MKKYIFLILALLFSVTIQADQLWLQSSNELAPLLVGKNEQFKLIPQHSQKTTSQYKIDTTYPKIIGENLSLSANNFNQVVNNIINQQTIDFLKNVKDSANISLQAQSYLHITYRLAGFFSQSQNSEIISVRFDINTYVKGMAHPYHTLKSINFDLAQNRVLMLKDLFATDADYLNKIATYTQKKLQGKNIPADMVKQGAAPTVANYLNWNLTLGGLLISFDQAQVAPSYFDVQEVLIPYDILKLRFNHRTACVVGVLRCDVT